jgi:hypothetical protein
MRKFVFIVLLLIMSLAWAAELQVFMTKSADAGINCRAGNQPNSFEFPIRISNPSQKSLTVSYEWYNDTSGAFIDMGKICDIVAGVGQSSAMPACIVTLYSVFGGVSGTDSVSFTVIGTDGNNTWKKTMAITLEHYVGTYEQDAINRINLTIKEYLEASSMLSNCYHADAETLLSNVSLQLIDAYSHLRSCDITTTLSLTNDALNKVRKAKADINAIPTSQCKSKGAPPVEVPPETTITPPTTNIETTVSSIMSVITTIGKTNCFGVTFFLLGAVALILSKR